LATLRRRVYRGRHGRQRACKKRSNDDGASGRRHHLELTVQVPGRFLLVAHSIVRAMEKGALGILEVVGAEQPGIFRTLVPGTHGTGGH
jgi:hypothetical protein